MASDPVDGALRITGGEYADELPSLLDWLQREDALRGRVSFEPHRPADGTQMGAVLDALTVALGSGGAGAVLAGSLSTWLSTRRTDVRLKITNGDGRSIELDARMRDIPALVGEIRRLVDAPESGVDERS